MQFIKEHKLEKNTLLLGFQKNPYKFINQCNAFVCSSRMEGYSLVIAESMILEIPVISTKCSGPNELLDYGKYGLSVNNSTEGIYEGMKSFLDNTDKYNEYKAKVKIRSKDFKLETAMRDIESILDED